jgi:hypothetical protein
MSSNSNKAQIVQQIMNEYGTLDSFAKEARACMTQKNEKGVTELEEKLSMYEREVAELEIRIGQIVEYRDTIETSDRKISLPRDWMQTYAGVLRKKDECLKDLQEEKEVNSRALGSIDQLIMELKQVGNSRA